MDSGRSGVENNVELCVNHLIFKGKWCIIKSSKASYKRKSCTDAENTKKAHRKIQLAMYLFNSRWVDSYSLPFSSQRFLKMFYFFNLCNHAFFSFLKRFLFKRLSPRNNFIVSIHYLGKIHECWSESQEFFKSWYAHINKIHNIQFPTVHRCCWLDGLTSLWSLTCIILIH